LDEYRATIGKLEVVKDQWALVPEHGVQFLVCVQSALHLKALHGEEWEDFVGQAGAFATIGPAGDDFTAEFMSKRCGTTTVLQRGFNIGDSVQGGGTVNSGTALSNTGPSSNNGKGSSNGWNRTGTFTVQQVERRAVLPQELRSMKPGEGRIWLQGEGTKSYPFFAPNYWKVDEPWAAAIRPNPYYSREVMEGLAGEEVVGVQDSELAEPANSGPGGGPDRTAEALQTDIDGFDPGAAETESGAAALATLADVLALPGVKTLLLSRYGLQKHPDANESERRRLTETLDKINAAYKIVERGK
jgi:hypothetical protein